MTAGVIVAVELLPVLLGAGADARVDWSFTYVSLRFILLPAWSLLLSVGLLVGSIRLSSWRERALTLSALAVPVGFLVASTLNPLPWLLLRAVG